MITDEQVDLIVERLVRRIELANISFLKDVGSYIKQIRKLRPTEAHQLIQILKYGGTYDEIVKKVSQYTDLNIKEVEQIFREYAKQDMRFYEQFYKYRNVPFLEYEENQALQKQTEALARIVQTEMYDYTRNNVLGYSIRDLGGNLRHLGLREMYNSLLDTAYLNVGQGKETFDHAIHRILKQIGHSGLKTIDYESGRSVRLDSTIRMHLKNRLRELHNENMKLFGEEFDSDGVEISVHMNPAPDHEAVQGRQFSTVKPSENELSEWEKLQAGEEAIDYKDNSYTLDHDHKNGYRPISEMNCYHYIFPIILGVSEPEYSDQQLKQIIDSNEQGFELDGKHYTNYQGTQLQRKLETEIRKQKDIQILGRESGIEQTVRESQDAITRLTNKYNKLSKASGLPTKMKRMRVSGYHRVKTTSGDSFKDSLVRDENGNLLKMYHGSTSNFKQFDVNKIREVDYDAPFNGFWFSSNKETSPAMMNSVYTKQVELNVTNPAPYNVWKDLSKKVESEYYNFYSEHSFDDNTKVPTFDLRSRSTNDEVRYRLQKMGYDGIHWNGKPDIDVQELEKTGRTKFTSVSGRGKYIMEKTDDEYVLEYSDGEHITSFESVQEYLDMQDEEWVVFDPKQIKILKQNIK